MKSTAIFVLLSGCFSLPALSQDAALLAAEKSRGVMTGGTGVQWTVTVSGSKSAKFLATSKDGKIFAEVLEPADSAGNRYLAEAKGDMWFYKPDLSRPVSVPKRQRLSGDAAIGDIASTSFVEGYKVAGQEPGDVNGEAATVYTMKANSLGDTYASIKYWVTNGANLGKKAEFYSKSGTLLRSSVMEYDNSAAGRPFLSKMTIQDGSRTIILSFSDVKIGDFPDSMFERDNLGGKKFDGPRK